MKTAGLHHSGTGGEQLLRVLRVIDGISEWSGRAVSYLVLLMIAAVTYEVVLRYLFRQPTIWAHETASFLFGAGGILGGAYVLRHDGHVKMDIFYSRFSRRGRAILDIITAPLFLGYCLVLLWAGGWIAWDSLRMLERSYSLWAPPIYPFKMTLPLAALLVVLQGLSKLTRDVFFLITGKEAA